MNEDTNYIIREYLVNNAGMIAFFAPDAPRIYCPRLPEKTTLPAISFFTRGGSSSPYIPPLPEPSVQFDCWAEEYAGAPSSASVRARTVYRALYDVLQGIQREVVAVGGTSYIIWSAIEEVQGQDLVDVDIQGYFRTMAFFKFMIKAT